MHSPFFMSCRRSWLCMPRTSAAPTCTQLLHVPVTPQLHLQLCWERPGQSWELIRANSALNRLIITMIPLGTCIRLNLQSRTWKWELQMQISLVRLCFFLRAGPADRSLWHGSASLSSRLGEALSDPSRDFGWDVLHRVPLPCLPCPCRRAHLSGTSSLVKGAQLPRC